MESYARPVPSPSALSKPFWAGTLRGELLLQKCGACGRFRWTPQYLCTECYAEGYEWTPVTGRGVVYTFTIVRRPPQPSFEAPYIVAVVELDEGPRMLTNIVGIDPAEVEIGHRVEVFFERATDEIVLYKFQPASAV